MDVPEYDVFYFQVLKNSSVIMSLFTPPAASLNQMVVIAATHIRNSRSNILEIVHFCCRNNCLYHFGPSVLSELSRYIQDLVN